MLLHAASRLFKGREIENSLFFFFFRSHFIYVYIDVFGGRGQKGVSLKWFTRNNTLFIIICIAKKIRDKKKRKKKQIIVDFTSIKWYI